MQHDQYALNHSSALRTADPTGLQLVHVGPREGLPSAISGFGVYESPGSAFHPALLELRSAGVRRCGPPNRLRIEPGSGVLSIGSSFNVTSSPTITASGTRPGALAESFYLSLRKLAEFLVLKGGAGEMRKSL